MRNALPLWLNVSSWPKRAVSIVGYPTTPVPRQRPMRKLSGARSGWACGPGSFGVTVIPEAYGRGGRPAAARHRRTTRSAQRPAIAAATTMRTATATSAATPEQCTVRGMATPALVVKVTAGRDDAERCNQALTVAAAAVASGVPVSLWLAGEAAWLALPGRAGEVALAHATPAGAVLAGGTVTVCTQCAARRGIGEADVLTGIRIAGAATFLAEVMADGARALVY